MQLNDNEDSNSSPMDPKENPEGTEHLPVAGEVGVGQSSYHDPTTTDTNDNPDSAIDIDMNTPSDQPALDNHLTDNAGKLGHKHTQPGANFGEIGNDPAISDSSDSRAP